MLYISTALYLEAQPFITIFSLKQQHEHTKFQVFSNDQVCLIITGTGELKASIAITYLFSSQKVGPHDLFINFGMCGSTDPMIPLGSAYVFHKLKDYSTKQDLYPDMLFQFPFQEASLETCPMQVGRDLPCEMISETFVDMEAYAIMYAITYYMQPHQVLFLKIVSDHTVSNAPSVIDKNTIMQTLMQTAQQLCIFLLHISENNQFFDQTLSAIEFSSMEQTYIQSISKLLHLSETMRHSLHQHIIYYKTRHGLAESVLSDFLAREDFVSCKCKTEGKKYFEQLKSKLMES